MAIQNGKDRLLNQSAPTPNVAGGMLDWFITLIFIKLEKTTVRMQVKETQTRIETQGVVQPLSPRKLQMKPEGQRKWDWLQIHALPNTNLEVDDVITSINFVDGNTPYRVMAKNDYSLYGYIEYQLVQDFNITAEL